jgi:hypothetical protein
MFSRASDIEIVFKKLYYINKWLIRLEVFHITIVTNITLRSRGGRGGVEVESRY